VLHLRLAYPLLAAQAVAPGALRDYFRVTVARQSAADSDGTLVLSARMPLR
jgi:hypothetical protein